MRKLLLIPILFLMILAACAPVGPEPVAIENVVVSIPSPYEITLQWDTALPSAGQLMVCVDEGECTWSEPDELKLHHIGRVNVVPGPEYHITILATVGDRQGTFEINGLRTVVTK
jgi:hypothetical protein